MNHLVFPNAQEASLSPLLRSSVYLFEQKDPSPALGIRAGGA
jgi:hypothetical protein